MTHTRTITITHKTSNGNIHALFHLKDGGLVDRIDLKFKKAGSEESHEMQMVADLINAAISEGKSLTRIQEMLGKRAVITKVIQDYIEVTK